MRKNKRQILPILEVAVLVMLVAGVLAACQPADQPGSPQGITGGNGQRGNFQMQPAPELPTAQPAVRGFIMKHDANGLVVQIGNANFGQGQGGGPGQGNGQRPTPNGTPRLQPTIAGAGTEVTVTVTSDTVIYQDVTFASLSGQQPPSGTIQQKVEKSSLDAVSDNMRVTVWGDRSGDQIAAKVVVYSPLQGFQRPPQ